MVHALLFFSALRPLEWAKPLILLLILSSASSANAIDVQVGQAVRPEGAVILVVDGLGASYVYPEHNAYALDGTLLKKALLFNLTGSGARVVDLRVPVPETTKSHSVLVTGDSDVDPQLLGPTIFDAARKEGYLCLAVLERGDAMPMLQEMDAVLYLEDNSISGSEPITGFRAGTPAGLCSLFQEWRDKFASYTEAQGVAGYAGYNWWTICFFCLQSCIRIVLRSFFNRVPHWVDDSIEWLKDIFGDFAPNGYMTKPKCLRKFFADNDGFLSKD